MAQLPRQLTRNLIRSLVGCIALTVVACGSTATQSITAPATEKCAVSLTSSPASFAAEGGAGTVAVDTQPECTWTASAGTAWLTGVSPTQGQGAAQLQFSVAANASASARDGSITVNGQRALIHQDAAACEFSVAPAATRVAASGGSGTVALSAVAGCPWTAAPTVNWVTVSPRSGTGPATLAYSVAANSGGERSGSITAGGATFAIVQDAAGAAPPPGPGPTVCAPAINPTSQLIPAAVTTGITVTVTAATGCAWTASSNVSWLTIASGAAGTSNGTVVVNAAANPGSARTGTVTIAGLTFTVNQAGTAAATCTYSLNPTSQSTSAAASTGNQVAVTTTAGCAWTATSNASWLIISSGASGSGNGTVTYSVAANSGAPQAGTLTIAGLTFTVNQASGCVFVVAPTSQTIAASGGAGLPVTVTTGLGCTWTATANASWLHITAGATGTGPGVVSFTADAYTGNGNGRSGSLTIAGQTITITQEKK